MNEEYILIGVFIALVIIIGVLCIVMMGIIHDRNAAFITYEETINKLKSSVPTLSIDRRLDYNQNLLLFIDSMIELELVNEKRFELFLNKNDKNLDIDKVLKSISTTVFESLNPDIYTSSDNIVTAEYLMNYIQKKTFMVCMSYIQNNVASQM